MVWKAKTSLAELLRRRKQTLQEWMSQMGMTSLDEIHAWCEANDGVVDVPLPRVTPTAEDAKKLPIVAISLPVQDLPKVLEQPTRPVVVEEKKAKQTLKKDESDPSSGTD